MTVPGPAAPPAPSPGKRSTAPYLRIPLPTCPFAGESTQGQEKQRRGRLERETETVEGAGDTQRMVLDFLPARSWAQPFGTQRQALRVLSVHSALLSLSCRCVHVGGACRAQWSRPAEASLVRSRVCTEAATRHFSRTVSCKSSSSSSRGNNSGKSNSGRARCPGAASRAGRGSLPFRDGERLVPRRRDR